MERIERRVELQPGEVLSRAGEWLMIAGPEGQPKFASTREGADPADCPVRLLMDRAEGKVSTMSRDLLRDLGKAGNHVIGLCIIEDYFKRVRDGG